MKIDKAALALAIILAVIRVSDAQTLPVYSYTVDPMVGYAPNGNLMHYNDYITGSWSMQYDSLNRLQSATAGPGFYRGLILQWGYDSFGNRLSQDATGPSNATLYQPHHDQTYGPDNRLWTDPQASIRNVDSQGHVLSGVKNDAAGNLTDDGINSFAYDGENRVCAVLHGGTLTQYMYDAHGYRVAKGHSVSSSGLGCPQFGDFIADEKYILGLDGKTITQFDTSNQWVHTNVYANGELLATYKQEGSLQPLHFIVNDPLGSKRVQTSASGAVESNCYTLPFGDELGCSGVDATANHFTGKERDVETGFANGNDYFGARSYGSGLGRFTVPDPSLLSLADPTNPQSLNLYSYVLNNPLVNVDPNGLDCIYFNSSGETPESIDQHSNADECGRQGGDWVNGTTSMGRIHYNANSDNFSVNSSDGDNSYLTGLKAPGSMDGGALCLGNCTQSYLESSNVQTISSSVMQTFIPRVAQSSIAFNRAIPIPCGIGISAGWNLGSGRFGGDLSTNKGLRGFGSVGGGRDGSSVRGSYSLKGTSESTSVNFIIPEAPFLSVGIGIGGGKISSISLNRRAPDKTGAGSVYVSTGNMHDGCKSW